MIPGRVTKPHALALHGLCASIVIFVALALGIDAAGAAKTEIYAGHFEGAKTEKVRLEVGLRRGEPRAVRFEAKNILLFCDDQTEQRIDVGPLRIPMRAEAAFSRTLVRGKPGSDRTYIGVDGWVLGDRAHGFLYYLFDAWDPPGEPYAADCSAALGPDTGGWTARRR